MQSGIARRQHGYYFFIGFISMQNKMVLITGATGGIGYAAALQLATMGAHVVLVGRNLPKTEAVVAEIRKLTGSPNVDYLIGDLSVQADVRRIVREYRSRYNRLDVLINNAGAMFLRYQVSAEGIEMTLALNHLAYFILTVELIDLLKASAPARVINVTSSSHKLARLKLNHMTPNKVYNGWLVYMRTKLMNVIYTYELARRLAGSGVTANCLHPGLIGTGIGQNNKGYRPMFVAYQRVAVPPEKGAEHLVYLACSPELAGISGKYFVKKNAVRSSKSSYDPDAGRRLWDFSLEMSNRQL